MSHHPYSYYGNVSTILLLTLLPPAILVSVIIILILARLCLKTKQRRQTESQAESPQTESQTESQAEKKFLDKVYNWRDKLFFSSFFVSATIILAQIFFGAGAIKQKRKPPAKTTSEPNASPPAVATSISNGNHSAPATHGSTNNNTATTSDDSSKVVESYDVFVINGRKYYQKGWVLGSIVYYNCVVIYVIIAVSLGFFYRQVPWSPEACKSSADCYYFNYSTVVTQDGEPTATPIINCTLAGFEAYNVNNMFCYDVGFHPVVGIAMLSSFINVVTPLLFAIVTRYYALFGEKMINEIHIGHGRICKREMRVLCFGLSIIQITISVGLLTFLVVNYYYISNIHVNSFQFFFSNEAYAGQGIGLCCVHILFVIFYPFAFIENYRIPEEGSTAKSTADVKSSLLGKLPSLDLFLGCCMSAKD